MFLKTAGALEKLLGPSFKSDWNVHSGEFHLGGIEFEMRSGNTKDTVIVENIGTGEVLEVNAAQEPLMIGDVLEFMLSGVAA